MAKTRAQKKAKHGPAIVPDERHACGKLIQPRDIERKEQIMAVVSSQPHRRGFADPTEAALGSVIAKLHKTREIDGRQFRAATRYGSLVSSMMIVISAPNENPQGIDLAGIRAGGALWSEAETDDERVKRENAIRSNYADACSALMDVGRLHYGLSRQGQIGNAVRDCVMRDQPVQTGDLRLGLNTLASLWGIE